MPRFQSRLFNLIDRSIPVLLGRRVRLWYDQVTEQLSERITEQIEQFQDRPEQIALFWQEVGRQTARALLYPIYIFTEAVKRSYPQLKAANSKVTPLLQPVKSLVVWVDNTQLFTEEDEELQEEDTGLANLEPSDRLAQLERLQKFLVELQEKWQTLGKQAGDQSEQQLERIRQLIKAAIAYFFGTKPPIDKLDGEVGDPWLSMSDLFGETNASDPAIAEGESKHFDSLGAAKSSHVGSLPDYKRQPNSNLANADRTIKSPATQNKSSTARQLKKKVAPTTSRPTRKKQAATGIKAQSDHQTEQQLEWIRQLIRAAIAYFFGSKPPVEQLDGEASEPWLSMADLFGDDSGPWPALSDRETAYIAQLPSYVRSEYSNLAKLTNPTAALTVNGNQSTALTAKDSQHHSQDAALVSNQGQSTSLTANSALETAKTSTSLSATIHNTSEIVAESQGWLEEPPPPTQTLQAWIDTPAVFLGYVYSPILQFIYWLDQLVARLEKWFIHIWQKVWGWVKKLFRFNQEET